MRKYDSSKTGGAIMEFALLLPLLMVPLIAGAWDLSKFIDTNQILTRAAREGVVAASRGDDPAPRVKLYIQSAGLEPDKLTVTVEFGPEEPGLGQEVAVTLAYNYDETTIVPWDDVIPGGLTSVAYAKME